MACDSLYVAWLKAHYPFELYATALQIFSEKKDKDKVAKIIAEMRKYEHINMLPSSYGQDNRDWSVDKEHRIISQNLSSIRYMQKNIAKELYELSKNNTAEMGVYYTKDEYTPEAAKRIKAIEKKLKPMQEEASQCMETDPGRFFELYDEGLPLEKELKELKESDSSYVKRAEEVHVTAELNCFTNLLRALQMNTSVKVNQIKILIAINYFSRFGKTGKLMKVFDYFFEGPYKLTKQIKSFEDRLAACRAYEESLPDQELSAGLRLRNEADNVGVCLTVDPSVSSALYFVQNIDDKYGFRANLYSIARGTTGQIRISRENYRNPIATGDCLEIQRYRQSPRYSYSNGKKTVIPNEFDIWVTDYTVHKTEEAS